MPRPKLNLVILDPASGRARPGAWVSIYHANTLTLSPLYSDDDVTGLANPVQANPLGQVAVRVDPGMYDVSATWDGTQPTLVEDVLAWDATAGITAPGDISIGDANGNPVRLPIGTQGQVLAVDNGAPAWRFFGPGAGLPDGAAGSLLGYGPGNTLDVIEPGSANQVLAMAGGVPTWSSLVPATIAIPINQPGDLMVGDATGAPARLARGATGDVLTVLASGLLGYANPTAGLPITTLGDLVVGDATGQPIRLPRGATGQALTVLETGDLAWIDPRVIRTLYFKNVDPGFTMPPTTLETTLFSWMMPGNTLSNQGDRLYIQFGLVWEQPATTVVKTIRVYFGTQIIATISGSYASTLGRFFSQILYHPLVPVNGLNARVDTEIFFSGQYPTILAALISTLDFTVPIQIKITGQLSQAIAPPSLRIGAVEIRRQVGEDA